MLVISRVSSIFTPHYIIMSIYPSSLDFSGEGQHRVLHVEGPQTLGLPHTPVAIHLDLTVLGGGERRGGGGGRRGGGREGRGEGGGEEREYSHWALLFA